MPPLLELKEITKRFGNLEALKNVTLRVDQGQIYGVLGENGAGKSTLMHILAGTVAPTSGDIRFDGRKVIISSPRKAFNLGVGMVYQHFKLVGKHSGLENLALFMAGGWLRGISSGLRQSVTKWTEELDWEIDWQTPVERLSVSQQQRIEIIKALCLGGRLLILDEPTAALTPAQGNALMAAVRRLAQRGITVLLISHKLAEVKNTCDRLLVLRRGRVIREDAARDVSTSDIISAMIGQDVAWPSVNRRSTRGAPVLDLIHEDAKGTANHPANAQAHQLLQANLQVCRGEIVGVCGVEGNGQEALAGLLTGDIAVRGRLTINGEPVGRHDLRHHLRSMGLIPADRQRDGLILTWPLNYNLVLKTHASPPHSKWGILRYRQLRLRNTALVRAFDIRAHSLEVPAAALSGGNQQKLILARELGMEPNFILAMNPTRGLDVGAAAFVMRQMFQARDRGAGIALIHDDLDEVLQMSDRLYILFGGRLYLTPWPQATRDEIGTWMLGENLPQLRSHSHGGGFAAK